MITLLSFTCHLFLVSTFCAGHVQEDILPHDKSNATNCSTDRSEVEVSLRTTADDSFVLIDTFCNEPFLLEKFIPESDVHLSDQELAYLISFKQGQLITAEDIKQACRLLKRKNKFESVCITKAQSSTGCILTFSLRAHWTFTKLQFKSSLTEKERFEHGYQLDSGEIFTLEKHQHSLQKISQELHNEGYLNAEVAGSVVYDKATKTVSVMLSIDAVDRFRIEDFDIKMIMQDLVTPEVAQKLTKKLKKRITGLAGYYTKEHAEQQRENIKKYLVRKGFFNPQIQLQAHKDKENFKVHLSYTIILAQKKRYVFSGNQFFSTEQLVHELLAVGSSIMLTPSNLLTDDIMTIYKKDGFWHATVECQEKPDCFFFLINEGPQVRVTSIQMQDTSNTTLTGIPGSTMAINTLFQEFCSHAAFNDELLKQSLEKLVTAFQQLGFWDITIVNKEYEALETADCYKLILTIETGKQRLLKSISIEGFPEIEQEKPFSHWQNLKASVPFNLYNMQEQRQLLLKHFQHKGFLYTKILPELKETEGGTVLIWHPQTSPGQICFGKTVIEGTSKLDYGIIMRELAYKEGDLFDKQKISRTLTRLKSLGIFDSLSLAPCDIQVPELYKTMKLKFVEDYPYEVRTRFGFQQVSKNFTRHGGSTYKIGGSFLWKNPLGQADSFRIDGDITRYTRNVSAQYELPWLGSYPIKTMIKGYSTIIEQPIVVGSPDRLYRAEQDGFLSNFTKDYTIGQGNFTAGAEWLKISGLSKELAEKIYFEPHLINKREPYLLMESSGTLNYLDNQLNPTTGFYTFASLRAMMALTLKKGSFLKVLLEQSCFVPLYNNVVIAGLRMRFGHIFNEQFNKIMPIERFYLGGSNSLRSYEPDMAPPLNSFIGSNNEKYWVPIGGRSMININAELRFPLYKQLSGVIFNDVGSLTHDNWLEVTEHDKWTVATGFGLRYDMPIGPIRFDIGWKWRKRQEDDRRYVWFLTLGHAF